VFIDFLRRLLRDGGGRKVHLIVDGHLVHRAKAVSAWIGRHPDRIELHFLPGHSPELNPVELLNHDVKADAAGRRRPRSGASSVLSCTGICVVAGVSRRSWSASSTTQ
jgi:transposase